MRSVKTKISAMIGMAISVISFALVIAACIVSIGEEPFEQGGVSRSFALWVFSVILAFLSMPFYFVDGCLCVVKAIESIHPLFNAVLALLLFGAIPMVLFVGGGLGINILIWNLYYAAILTLEMLSIVKHVRMSRADREASCETERKAGEYPCQN